MYRICILDDHQLFAEGLAGLLATVSGVEYVTSLCDSGKIMETLDRECINTLLLDLNMPGTDGWQVLEQLRQTPAMLPLRVIVLSSRVNPVVIQKTAALGIHGYCSKNVPVAELSRAIAAVHGGAFYLSEDLRGAQPPQLELAPLTTRELELLPLLQEGLSSGEIAVRLNISRHTVVSHRRNLLEKLGAKDTPELLNTAIRYGLL